MPLIAVAALPFVVWDQSKSPPKIGSAEAADYIGKSVIVTGVVAEVHVSEKLVRLNLDKKFPQQPFTAVIFAGKTNQFQDLAALKGKSVEVTGTVAEYRSRPEIVVGRTNQLAFAPVEKK